MLLYHYTTEKNALLYILNTFKLKFGKSQHTNDPRENKAITPRIIFDHGAWIEKYENYDEIPLSFSEKQLNVNIHTHFNIQVLCFCTDKNNPKNVFDYGYSKPRMWTQYGENHSGCCLIFDKANMDDEFKKIQLEKYSGLINYNLNENNKSFTVNFTIDDLENNITEKILMKSYMKNIRNILFRKSPDWKEEREYRYMIIDSENKNNFIDISKSLKGIIFSYDYNTDLEDYILKKCEDSNIKLFKLNWKNGIPLKYDLLHDKQMNLLETEFIKLKNKIAMNHKDLKAVDISGVEIVNMFKKQYPKDIDDKNKLVQLINNYYNIYYSDNSNLNHKTLLDEIKNFRKRIK